jgi:hypothetical protein
MIRNLDPMQRRSSGVDGSAMVEALVGLGLMVALTSAIAGVHASVAAAEATARGRTEAIRTAQWVLEHHAAGLVPHGDAGETQGFIIPLRDDPCAATGAVGLGGVEARAFITRIGVEVGLVAAQSRGDIDRGPRGFIRLGSGSVLPIGMAHRPLDTSSHAPEEDVVVTGGCLVTATLPNGLHEVFFGEEGGVSMVDPLHRSADDAPLLLSVHTGAVRSTWEISPAATLRVEMETFGARTPDEAVPGGLRWLVRGDDGRTAAPIGATRFVHPGRVEVAVSACGNPEAQASTAIVTAHAGEVVDVDVPLAVATIRNVRDRTGGTIVLYRTNACHDGSGSVPVLHWIGGLSEGMAIALPHGHWDGELREFGSSLPVGFFSVAAGEPGLVVNLP